MSGIYKLAVCLSSILAALVENYHNRPILHDKSFTWVTEMMMGVQPAGYSL